MILSVVLVSTEQGDDALETCFVPRNGHVNKPELETRVLFSEVTLPNKAPNVQCGHLRLILFTLRPFLLLAKNPIRQVHILFC